jgi:RNA polymerase sigma factor (sigma-70 family)
MSDRRQDFELLQRFTRDGEQSAFGDLVRRHLDLVFATAVRKVEDAGAAQEVAQNVFAVLARKAWQFAPDDSLPAWLHKAALLESKSWLRGELGRRRRELTAAELHTTMHTPEEQSAFQALLPLLDEALLSLREKDRTALLLRFYESQSLRDVGVAFGVTEDTAQKRVQSALQKLTEFFKEQGFKTASVAAAAAALQNTATSASATMVSTVVSAALQAAPPALVGLGAWLARLTSLTRVQTGALCVALAALPVGWHLKERHEAVEVGKRIQAQLLDAQSQYAGVQNDLNRLTADSQGLEQALLRANEAATQAAESAKAFDVWKKRIRAQLMGDDYRWSDESPFARIPKAALRELAELSPFGLVRFSPPGIVEPPGRELLGLAPAERQSLEETLHRHFTDVERKREVELYETNKLSATQLPDPDVAVKVFVVPTLPKDEMKQRLDQLLAEVRVILGEERWPLVQARSDRNSYGGSERIVSQLKQELEISVKTDDKGTPTWSCGLSFGGGVGFQNGTLSMFLPQGDPNRTEGADRFAAGFSDALRQRAMVWLQEQAIARVGKGAKP